MNECHRLKSPTKKKLEQPKANWFYQFIYQLGPSMLFYKTTTKPFGSYSTYAFPQWDAISCYRCIIYVDWDTNISYKAI